MFHCQPLEKLVHFHLSSLIAVAIAPPKRATPTEVVAQAIVEWWVEAVALEKTPGGPLLSIEPWLFHRDPYYVMVG